MRTVEKVAQKIRQAPIWLKFARVTAALLASGLPALAAQPVPTAAPKIAAPALLGNISATSRHCGGRQGRRSCRGDPDTGARHSDYFEYNANTLPFGTERWRDQMRRENRLGNPG
jgi:hypothetical protein